MKKKRGQFRNAMALALGVLGLSGNALAINEVESNNLFHSAQELAAPLDLRVARNGARIDGSIATPSPWPDIDFYSFYAEQGQKLTVHLENTGTFNAVITVVTPSLKVKAEKYALVQGEQVRLEDVDLNETGIWAVVVTPLRVLIGNPGGQSFQELIMGTSPRLFPPTSGSYTLVLTPALPTVLPIGIDVKPGSDDRAPINRKAKGAIPVALLAAPDFDPFKVKVDSLRFGVTGDERSLRRCAPGGVDVDADGDLDRVCTFENNIAFAALTPSTTMAYLKGQTTDGVSFQGHGYLKILPTDGQQ